MMRLGQVVQHDEPRPVRLGFKAPHHNLPVVLIRKEALVGMYNHAKEGYPVEIGGYFVGFPMIDVDTGLKITYVEQIVRAISTSTHTHVTMHPESFNAV